ADRLPKEHRRYEVVYRPYEAYSCNDNIEMFVLDDARVDEARGTLSAVKEQRGKYSHILAVSKRTASELEAIYDDYADEEHDEI
ncbi:GGDEF domain-containing protein, partial [Brevibacillus sp. SIMBA_076]